MGKVCCLSQLPEKNQQKSMIFMGFKQREKSSDRRGKWEGRRGNLPAKKIKRQARKKGQKAYGGH